MRFAIIGCGQIATTHARALRRLAAEAELVVCCDIVPERASALAATFDVPARSLEQLLADPAVDAVTVCTPSGSHAEVGVPALLAGKHVLVEKPMDVDVARCDALLDAARVGGGTLGVVSQRRFDTAAARVKRAVEAGQLGDVLLAECRVAWYRTQEYYDAGDWRGTWALEGGGSLMNQGLHTLDLLRWACGPVTAVSAVARTAGHERMEVEDLLCATLTFANGALGTVIASTCAYPGLPARLAIHGTRGGAVVEGDALGLLALADGRTAPPEAPKDHAVLVATGGTRAATAAVRAATSAEDAEEDWTDGHVHQLRDFVRAAGRGDAPAVDGHEGRETVRLIRAIYEAARTGRTVRLEDADSADARAVKP